MCDDCECAVCSAASVGDCEDVCPLTTAGPALCIAGACRCYEGFCAGPNATCVSAPWEHDARCGAGDGRVCKCVQAPTSPTTTSTASTTTTSTTTPPPVCSKKPFGWCMGACAFTGPADCVNWECICKKGYCAVGPGDSARDGRQCVERKKLKDFSAELAAAPCGTDGEDCAPNNLSAGLRANEASANQLADATSRMVGLLTVALALPLVVILGVTRLRSMRPPGSWAHDSSSGRGGSDHERGLLCEALVEQ